MTLWASAQCPMVVKINDTGLAGSYGADFSEFAFEVEAARPDPVDASLFEVVSLGVSQTSTVRLSLEEQVSKCLTF